MNSMENLSKTFNLNAVSDAATKAIAADFLEDSGNVVTAESLRQEIYSLDNIDFGDDEKHSFGIGDGSGEGNGIGCYEESCYRDDRHEEQILWGNLEELGSGNILGYSEYNGYGNGNGYGEGFGGGCGEGNGYGQWVDFEMQLEEFSRGYHNQLRRSFQ